MLAGVVDFAIAFVVLVGLMALLRHRTDTCGPAPAICSCLLALISALAVGLWLSALNVKYRDIRYVVPFLTQFWMYATPIAYSSSTDPGKVALALQPEPDDRRGGRFSLGHPGQEQPGRDFAGISAGHGYCALARRRAVLFQAHGNQFRGHYLT